MAILQALTRRRHLLRQTFDTIIRNYSTPGHLSLGKKLGKTNVRIGGAKSVDLPVEKDTKKLAAFVCGTNLMKESGEDIQIKPDSEYPNWLWTLHTGEPRPLSELNSNTLEYWERVREIGMKQKKEISSLYQQNRDYK